MRSAGASTPLTPSTHALALVFLITKSYQKTSWSDIYALNTRLPVRSPPHHPNTSLLFLTPVTAVGDTHSNTEGNTAADEPRRRRRRFWWSKKQTTSEVTRTEERLGYALRLWAYARWLYDRTWRILARRCASFFGAPAASPETWLYPLMDLFLAISSETSPFCKCKAHRAALVAFALAYQHSHYTYQTPQKTPPQGDTTFAYTTRENKLNWLSGASARGIFS